MSEKLSPQWARLRYLLIGVFSLAGVWLAYRGVRWVIAEPRWQSVVGAICLVVAPVILVYMMVSARTDRDWRPHSTGRFDWRSTLLGLAFFGSLGIAFWMSEL